MNREIGRSGPIAALFSTDEDGEPQLEDFEVAAEPETPDGDYPARVAYWFEETWRNHSDHIKEVGEGRAYFIICCQLISTEINSIDYGTDYDEEMEIDGVL